MLDHIHLVMFMKRRKKVIKEHGGTYHDERDENPSRKWRYLIQKEKGYNDQKTKEQAQDFVAMVIKDILLPTGNQPKEGESVLVHCGGGMHRTGMIVGIIRKVFSDADVETEILVDYRKHVGWKSEEQPGGREALNEKFILEFPEDKIKDLKNIKQYQVADGKFSERGY